MIQMAYILRGMKLAQKRTNQAKKAIEKEDHLVINLQDPLPCPSDLKENPNASQKDLARHIM